jgi:hypothetical protein
MDFAKMKDNLFKAFNDSFEIFSLEYRYMYSAVLEDSLDDKYFDNMILNAPAMSTKVYFYVLKTILMNLSKDEKTHVISIITKSYSDEKKERIENAITTAINSCKNFDNIEEMDAYEFLKSNVVISYNIISSALIGIVDIISELDAEVFKKIVLTILGHKVDIDMLFGSYVSTIPVTLNGVDVTDKIKKSKNDCQAILEYAKTVGDIWLEARIAKIMKDMET